MEIGWSARNGNAEVITLEGLEGSVTETIERTCGDASCKLTNVCAWGRVNPDPYENRGWCCSEFTIAKFNGTIVNDDRADVQAVLNARTWPSTVLEYAEMMAATGELAVRFTKKGDADVVRFLFYRVCFGMLDSFYANAVAPTRYVAPTAAWL